MLWKSFQRSLSLSLSRSVAAKSLTGYHYGRLRSNAVSLSPALPRFGRAYVAGGGGGPRSSQMDSSGSLLVSPSNTPSPDNLPFLSVLDGDTSRELDDFLSFKCGPPPSVATYARPKQAG